MKLFLTLSLLACLSVNTLAQTPMNSNLSAQATIFLDLDGHTVAGTNWNGDGPIYCGPSGLNETQVLEIFNRVAEDYRPFQLNITTDSTRYWAAPVNKRMRVIVTVTSDWYGPVGGTAMVGTFSSGDNTPCFVFSARLGYDPKKIGEAVSHEAGHTLGLYHQSHYDASCNKLSDYHYGFGSGEIGWAPIMGVGYYQNLTLWNNGPNSLGCTSMQNDLQVITTTNGFSYRADDHANSFSSATTTSFSGNQFNASGIIERSSDQDLFKFILPAAGRFQLAAVPYNVGTGNAGSDIDIQVTLFNSVQTMLNTYNPGSLLNSMIDSNLNAGTYYLRIEGRGNQYAPNYASLGSYAVQGTFTGAVALPVHKLALNGAAGNGKHRLSWEIVADEPVTNLEIEVSSDGRTFSSLAQLFPADRAFSYQPSTRDALQYRLRVTLGNGREYYSNLVVLRYTSGIPRPILLKNVINNDQLPVSSPGKFDYIIYDMGGRVHHRGQLSPGLNTLLIPTLSQGIYMIRYKNQEHEWTEKFVRQ